MSLSQTEQRGDGSDNMGTSWEEERADLQVVKHQFFEWKSFCPIFPLRSQSMWGRRMI